MCSRVFIQIEKFTKYDASFETNAHLNLGMNKVMNSVACAKVLKALGDDTRLKILDYLFTGEYSVSDISDSVGVEYSQVSHHLRVLRSAGLVSDSKDGKFVLYKLDPIFYNGSGTKKNMLDFECCRIEFNSNNHIKGKRE